MAKGATESLSKRVVLDLDRCIECRSCAAACYYSHANMPAIHHARAGVALLPTVCRQCKAAPCVDACPVEAMVRDDLTVVRRLMFRCIGCGCCAVACPFGVIPNELAGVPAGFRSPDRMTGHQVAKCDLCEDRVMGDPDAVPRCVAACPAGALLYADAEEIERKRPIVGGRTTCEDPYKRR